MDLLDTRVYSIIGEEGFTRLIAAFYAEPGLTHAGPPPKRGWRPHRNVNRQKRPAG